MLVDFSVENFGPFKNEALLTMTFQKGSEHPENYVETRSAGKVLTAGVLFGPNASGKTCLFDALALLKNMVTFHTPPGAAIEYYNPFRLSSETKDAPVKMKIKFTTDDVLYDYQIAFDKVMIITESLYHYPNGKRAKVFFRTPDKFEFGRLAGGVKSISKMLSPNATALYVAAQFNNEICRKAFRWFYEDMFVLTREDRTMLLEHMMERVNKDVKLKEKVIKALKAADFPISDIRGTVRKGGDASLSRKNPMVDSGEIGEFSMGDTRIFLQHDIGEKVLEPEERYFPIQMESAGTLKFLSLIVPVMDALTYGKTLLIDDFEQELHCELSRWIIGLFRDKAFNTGMGQLIVNTHGTYLMDQDMLLRRDQIFLVSRNEWGESEIYSISDFGERKDRVLMTSYLDGRYGAIPFIDEGAVF